MRFLLFVGRFDGRASSGLAWVVGLRKTRRNILPTLLHEVKS